jgi:hypothetical protein
VPSASAAGWSTSKQSRFTEYDWSRETVYGRGRVTRARRKRSRPDVALEFPDVPDARASGFLIETQLRSGRNQISIQVQDEQKRWRTFFSTAIKVLPLDLLEKAGFPNVRDHLADKLQHRRTATSTHLPMSESVGGMAERPQFQPGRVVIYGTLRSNLLFARLENWLQPDSPSSVARQNFFSIDCPSGRTTTPCKSS